MLDTCTCIELLRSGSRSAFSRMKRFAPGEVALSSVTLAELWYGAFRSSRPEHHEAMLVGFCAPLAIEAFDSVASETYGRLRATLERAGTPIGPLDTLIAAHALSMRVALVTDNEREFRRVPGLRVENWLR